MKEKIKMITYTEGMSLDELRGNLVVDRDKYYQYSTMNESFIESAEILKAQGIKNSMFMLELFDKDLADIDPEDPKLSTYMKNKVLTECARNIWYFMREIAKIPTQGGGSIPTKVSRTTLANIYCYMNDINSYTTTPRQQYSTITQILLVTHEYLFGDNSNITYRDKNTESNELYAERLQGIISKLPKYIRNVNTVSGTTLKSLPVGKTRKEIIAELNNFSADIIFLNDFEYMKYPMTFHDSLLPVFAPNSMNRKIKGLRSVININSAAGNMEFDEMPQVCSFLDMLCSWSDQYYDLPPFALKGSIEKNSMYSMVYIGFSYRELGLTEEWFSIMSKMLCNKEKSIKRELLLERV